MLFFIRLFKKVKLQNQVIEKSLNEKYILWREIHHRVKVNYNWFLYNLAYTDRQKVEIDEDNKRADSFGKFYKGK
jgi:two-component sensor histidine kinase